MKKKKFIIEKMHLNTQESVFFFFFFSKKNWMGNRKTRKLEKFEKKKVFDFWLKNDLISGKIASNEPGKGF